MTIDITSFFFNSSIEGATATPAWGTSVGQNQTKSCRIEDEKPGVMELLTGMLYKSISDKSRLDISAGSSNREILLFSKFDKVYINNKLLEDQSFVMLLVRENTESHAGRLIISYPPYALIDETPVNDMAIKEMASTIGCKGNGCWFVHDISVRNQDELHFSAVVVDAEKPKVYHGKSKERSREWANLVGDTRKYTLSELGDILNKMYSTAEPGKQVAMIYIFVFTYGEHLVDIYKSNEIIDAASLNPSYKTEVDKAYNIYRYAAKKRLSLFKYGSVSGCTNPVKAQQTIYYGAPGTGKSWKIKNEIIPEGIKPYRITFYSDYYYSDFVGGLRPKTNPEKKIEYNFEPGPFAKALKDAFLGKSTYVIIEEINRGNAAAIFGDLFQLLDRKGGSSEYSITNHDLYQYLVDEGVTGLEEDKVYIPDSLNILCTMNTADQNVFVLDTAFKRRFKMKYVPINFKAFYVDNDEANGVKEECKGYLENVEIFNHDNYNADLKAVMGDELYSAVSKVIVEPKRDWPTFASMVNAKIDQINKEEQKISEDKKLGPFFVDTDELKNRQAFSDKVIYYLKQDVFKYEDTILDDSYEKLYDEFVNKEVDIFKIFHPAR